MSSLDKIENIFLQALSETFENLVFEEVVVQGIVEAEPDLDISESWWVKIEVIEPFASELILVVRKDLMIQYTEAIFGMLDDEMPAETQILDNLGELMNTFCGRIMALLLQSSFRLGLPEAGDGRLPALKGKFLSVNCLIGDNLVFLLVPESFCKRDFALN